MLDAGDEAVASLPFQHDLFDLVTTGDGQERRFDLTEQLWVDATLRGEAAVAVRRTGPERPDLLHRLAAVLGHRLQGCAG